MTQRKIGNSWWVDITYSGIRHRKKSPANTKEGAKTYEAHLRRSLAQGETLEDSDKKRKRAQPFDEYAWIWFQTYVVVHNKPSEIVRKRHVLNKQIIPFFRKTPINKISTLQVEQFKAHLVTSGLSNRSINCHLWLLGKCLRDADEWYELPSLPKIKTLKTPPDEVSFLEKAECERLLANLDGQWREIVLTALKTGLRLGELRALRWQDINWDKKLLSVNHTWCQVSKGLVAPKSNKGRTVPLTHDVYSLLLRRRAEDSEFIFSNGYGYRFGCQPLNNAIAKACKNANIRKITCHCLRHTYASHLALAGVPLVVIQRLLGHSSIQMTMRYAHLSNSSLNDAIGALEASYSA